MGWVLDHLDDLESDFSAIHHIHIDIEGGEFGGLSSRRFFAHAERVAAYPGVIQARLLAEDQRRRAAEEKQPITPDNLPGGRVAEADSPSGGRNGVKVIPLTPELAAKGMGALGLGGLVDYATSG